MEIDVHFVRKAVRAIGKLAIKIEAAVDACIRTLLELVATKVSYIVQEATVVIRNIFRKYPNQYETIISVLCEHLDSLSEPEAKAAMIWVIGQYADRIENSEVILEDFLFTFAEETHDVQLALLTATVKLFIQRPTKGQDLVPRVLKWATEETDNPDLRDRGYMYWRLLSSDPNAAKAIIMGEKPPITAETEKLDPTTLEEMCLNIGTLATIYLKPVQQVFRQARHKRLQDSPALQKWQLPTSEALLSPQHPVIQTSGPSVNGNAADHGNMTAADAAQLYFSNISSQQIAQMSVRDTPLISSPVNGGPGHSLYIVNQNQPQQAFQSGPGQANEDLLVL